MVLSETWNFRTALAFPKIDACLPTSNLSLAENWVYFLFLDRIFCMYSIIGISCSSTIKELLFEKVYINPNIIIDKTYEILRNR